MLRVISELRPDWVVGENVAGIVNMALDQVYADLENEGYSVQAFIIPACAVDAPHRRDRCAIIGCRTLERKHNGRGRRTYSLENSDCVRFGEPGVLSQQQGRAKFERDGKDVAHADCNRLEKPWLQGLQKKQRVPASDGGWWPAEPNVGRSLDGVSCWLDGIGGLSNEAKERAREILRNLREETVSETVQWTIGRFNSISKAEVLLAFLCEYEEECNGSRISLESRTISERKLRDL